MKVYAVIGIYDIGSCHPESNVQLFLTREEAEVDARERRRDDYPWEDDPDLTDEQRDTLSELDAYHEGYIRIEEFIIPDTAGKGS